MGFLDKAKEAADRAVANTQQMAKQGQAKFDGYQSGKGEGELYRALGEAFFNEQRHGADRGPVVEALSALDTHFAAVAAAAAAAAAQPAAGYAPPAQGYAPQPGAAAPAPASPSSPAAPAGNFTLDDL